MKNVCFIFLIGYSSFLGAASEDIQKLEWTKYKNCQAPSQPFFESRIRQSYMIETAEGKLKDVVHSLKNYPLREEIKELNLRLTSVEGDEKSLTSTEIQAKFDQMLENVHLALPLHDFPQKKANSIIKGSPESGLVMSMDNLSQDDVDFLPETILKKLGKNVKVEYFYPQKTFDYIFSYDGEEMPMAKVTRKIQKEFEVACEERVRENEFIRFKNSYDAGGGQRATVPSATSRGGAAQN
jgi:hypothetical protein